MPTRPQRKTLKIERHISASLFKSIGLLIVMSSTMEYILANALLRLIGTSRSGVFHAYPLVTGMDFKVKISLIRVFTTMYSLPKAKEINDTLDKIDALFSLRNTVSHSILLPTRQKDRAKFQDLRAKIKLGGPPQPRVHSAAYIRASVIEMHGLVDVLNQLLTDSGVRTQQEYDEIALLNRLLDRETAQSLAANQANPTTQKKSSEPHS